MKIHLPPLMFTRGTGFGPTVTFRSCCLVVIPYFALGIRRSAEESQQECQDLRAQLRKMEAGAKTGPEEEEAQRRLRKAERSAGLLGGGSNRAHLCCPVVPVFPFLGVRFPPLNSTNKKRVPFLPMTIGHLSHNTTWDFLLRRTVVVEVRT